MIPTKIRALLSCILLAALASPAARAADYGYYDDDAGDGLAAPNVSWFAGAQVSRNNLHYLGSSTETGVGVLFGGYFDDIKLAGLHYGVEFSYLTTGEGMRASTRNLTATELSGIIGSPASGTLTSINKLRITGIGFGGRIAGDRFFVRFGGSMYSLQTSHGTLVRYFDSSNNPLPANQNPADKGNKSGFAPFAGLGAAVPLANHLKLSVGYDVNLIESHRLGSAYVGLLYVD